VALTKVVKDIT